MRHYYNRNLLTIFLLGFSSGLPLSLIGPTLQAWYTVSGVSLAMIGWLTLIGQPYAYKFLWAPFLDHSVPFSWGRRRSWIFLMQGLLALICGVMAFMHPAQTPYLLAFLALLVAFFSATQDTAFDAYRTELLFVEERGIGTSVYTIAYRLAMIVSGAVALIVAAVISWRAMYLMMSGCFLALMFVTRRAPNPRTDNALPNSIKEALTAPLRAFFSRKHAAVILIFIVLYKLPDGMASSLNITFLIRGVGFELLQIGAISKTIGLVALLLGSVVGGLLLPFLGVFRSLWIFGLLQLSSNLLYAWLALVGKNILMMSVAIFGENFCSGLATVALVVYLMGLCDVRYTATQYALFSAVASLGRIFIGPLSAVIVQHVGWIDFYMLSAMIGLPSILLVSLLNTSVDDQPMTVKMHPTQEDFLSDQNN